LINNPLNNLRSSSTIIAIVQQFANVFSNLDSHLKELLQGASIALLLKLIAAAIGFVFNVAIARMLGADGSGVYFIAFTVITIAASIGEAGMRNTLVRFVAINASIRHWNRVKEVYNSAMLISLFTSVILAGLVFAFSGFIAQVFFKDPRVAEPLRWMSLAIAPFALFSLHAESLKGLKRIATSTLISNILTPMFALIGVFFLVPSWGVNGAVWSYTIATILTLFIGTWFWKRSLPRITSSSVSFPLTDLLSSSMPLFWASILNLFMLKFSVLILGFYETSDKVGIFHVAHRTAFLISFIFIAVNSIASPKFAELYQMGEMTSLGKLARMSTNVMTITAFPLLILFCFLPKQLMQIFGAQFVDGAAVLAILGIGHFIKVAAGSVDSLLMMSGNEKIWRNIHIAAVLVNIITSLTLIPLWGIIGAAIAVSTTLAIQMMLGVLIVWKRFAIITLPFFQTKLFRKTSL
jgi:O-antigen/teichoic acid export membrane protein